VTLEDVASVARETGSGLLEDSVPRKTQRRRANVYGLLACQGDSLTFGSRDPDGMSYPCTSGAALPEARPDLGRGEPRGAAGRLGGDLAPELS